MMSCYLRATGCQDVVNCCSTFDIKLVLMTKTAEEVMICLSLFICFRSNH